MGKQNTYLYSFAGGQIDKYALPRVDLQQMRLAAETQNNLLCTSAGYAFFRPGTEFMATTVGNSDSWIMPFIRDASNYALVEFGESYIRVLNDGEPVTRASVTSTVTSGDFAASTGWTTTGVNAGTATISGGVLTLNAVALGGVARCKQQVSTSSPNVEHALRVVVTRGPVVFECGSADGTDDYITQTTLRTGTHSLAFTPTGSSYWIRLESTDIVDRIVDSVTVEAAGVMSLPNPYALADCKLVRTTQSLDVLFMACAGYQQRRLERRGDTSWSICLYQVDDGPFRALPSANLKIKAGAFTGNTTLTSDRAFFKPEHVGALFRLDHTGQSMQVSVGGDDQWTRPIRVSGVSGSGDRDWSYTITGTWAGTINVRRSYDGEDVGYRPHGAGITTNGTATVSDTDDNAIIYYRMGFPEGSYTSGAATIAYTYDGGTNYGICRVTGYTSSTSVNVEILRPMASTGYTSDWRESEWSDAQVWPSAGALFDGRMWWSGNDRIWGSISDAYESYDESVEGDSGTIARSIAVGLGGQTNWILTLQRLLFGTDGCEASMRSSSLDEPLTPTNLTIRTASTVGSSSVDSVQIDGAGLFIDGSGKRLFETIFSTSDYDLKTTELSMLVRDILSSGVRQIAVQRRPDTRIYFVMDDGTAVCLIYVPGQQMAAFIPISTEGELRSVAVLPGAEQDYVFFVAKHVVLGEDKYFVERMALDTETKPGTVCKMMDCHTVGSEVTPTTSLAVGAHLAGHEVVVWADGEAYPGPYTVAVDGSIMLETAVSEWCAGLAYTWRYKSSRLAYAAQMGTPVSQPGRIDHLGIIATDFHRDGIKYGAVFDDANRPLDPLPEIEGGADAASIYNDVIYDEISLPFDGQWTTDSRLCLSGQSPYPAKILGLTITITKNDRL